MGAIFKKSNLKLYEVISEPGTYIVKSAGKVKTLIEDGSKSRYLCNLRVATIDMLENCLEIMGHMDQIPFDEVGHCFITGAIWENDVENKMTLPTKGENLIATFDYVDDVMRCVSITLIPRKRLQTFDPEAYDLSRRLLKDILG